MNLEILQYSYWEHFKAAKELSFIFPPEHEKRILLQSEIDKLIVQIQNVKPKNELLCGKGQNIA